MQQQMTRLEKNVANATHGDDLWDALLHPSFCDTGVAVVGHVQSQEENDHPVTHTSETVL